MHFLSRNMHMSIPSICLSKKESCSVLQCRLLPMHIDAFWPIVSTPCVLVHGLSFIEITSLLIRNHLSPRHVFFYYTHIHHKGKWAFKSVGNTVIVGCHGLQIGVATWNYLLFSRTLIWASNSPGGVVLTDSD